MLQVRDLRQSIKPVRLLLKQRQLQKEEVVGREVRVLKGLRKAGIIDG